MQSNMWTYEKLLKDMIFDVFSAGYKAGLSESQTFADSFSSYYKSLCCLLDAKEMYSIESEEKLMHVYLAGYRTGSPGKPPLAKAFETWYQKEAERNA